jgi:hypothetical protein
MQESVDIVHEPRDAHRDVFLLPLSIEFHEALVGIMIVRLISKPGGAPGKDKKRRCRMHKEFIPHQLYRNVTPIATTT